MEEPEETAAGNRGPSKAPDGQSSARLSTLLQLRGPSLPSEQARAAAAARMGKVR